MSAVKAVEILLIEDCDDEAEIIALLFSRSPDFAVRITHVHTVAEALRTIQEQSFAIVLLDLGLPDNVGVEAVKQLNVASPQTPVFVLTGDDRRTTGLAAIEAGAQDYLPKQHMAGRLLSQMAEHCIARQRRLRLAEERSMQDELTGLGNRRGCDFRFAEALRSRVARGNPMFAVLIDIDLFKQVNDRWGHAAGDTVIRQVAESLSNTIGDRGVAFRYGGEEFVVFAWLDHREMARVMEQLRAVVANLRVQADHRPITISLGATAVRDGETKRDVFERADAALYQSKQRGRNCGSVHTGAAIVAVPAGLSDLTMPDAGYGAFSGVG